jgi:hypothetical protein
MGRLGSQGNAVLPRLRKTNRLLTGGLQGSPQTALELRLLLTTALHESIELDPGSRNVEGKVVYTHPRFGHLDFFLLTTIPKGCT